jgi:hypothetical protein
MCDPESVEINSFSEFFHAGRQVSVIRFLGDPLYDEIVLPLGHNLAPEPHSFGLYSLRQFLHTMVYLLGSLSVEAHTRPLQQLGICLEIAYEQVVLRMDFVSVLCEGLGMGHPLVFGFAVGQHQLSDLVLGW